MDTPTPHTLFALLVLRMLIAKHFEKFVLKKKALQKPLVRVAKRRKTFENHQLPLLTKLRFAKRGARRHLDQSGQKAQTNGHLVPKSIF